MTVRLRPMDEEDYRRFVGAAVAGYIDQLVDSGGWTRDQARAKADADFARLLPDGLSTPNEHLTLIVAEASGNVVGRLWFSAREQNGRRHLYVHDLEVLPAARGHGHGRAAMLALEDEARRLGLDELRLNVFGHNEVARGLYRSLGYAEVAVEMQKHLDR
jgi:ribosomal protein S18 acetylase RimI-like enzyme